MATSFDYRRLLGRIFRRRRFKQAQKLLPNWVSPPSDLFVASMQLEKIQHLWNDAIDNIPYYSELVRKRNAPRKISSIRQFVSEVPILTKQDLMKNGNLFNRKKTPHHVTMTAGSTGEPFQFGVWRRESEICAINQIVGRIANGMDINDSIFFIWGHSHLLGTGFKGKLKNAERKLRDICMNYKRVDAYKLDQHSVEEYQRVLRHFSPKIVVGYSSALDLFVRQSENLIGNLGIKMVIATSEILPYENSKERIMRFFGASLIMEYGGVDFGVVSYEGIDNPRQCVFWWSHFVEVTEDGECVVTPLYTRYLPLIRFGTGDQITEPIYFSHGCVKSFGEVLGRKHDYIEMSDKKLIHSVGIFHSIHHIKSVKGIQLVIDKGEFVIQLVSDDLSQQEISSIRKRLNDLHPSLGEAHIKLVRDLDTNIAGKRSWIRKIS